MNPKNKFPYVLGLILALLGVAMLFPFSGGAARGPQTSSQTASKADDLPNFDAFGASTRRAAAASAQANQGEPQYEGSHMVQFEPRLGVPTFLWAGDPGPARSLVQLPAQGNNDTSAAAKDHLNRYATRYRLSPDDVGNARVVYVHDTGQGAIIVKLKQDI